MAYYRSLKMPFDIQKEQETGKELVDMAEKGDLEGLKTLLECGASVNAEVYNRSLFYKSQNYMTPLQCAASRGYSDLVEHLIHNKADLDAKDRFDVTAVHMAAEYGHVHCLKLLLDAGAACITGTKYSKRGAWTAVPHVGGTTPLHLAAKNDHASCVEELILNGADYNAVDEKGRTSLYIAAQLGHSNAVLKHLRNAMGRDILSIPVVDTGETPLHHCVRRTMFACVQELLRHGSDVNHRDNGGCAPIHLAFKGIFKDDHFQSDAECLQYCKEMVLRGHNADVNLPDTTGATPLHYASLEKRRPHVAAFLIAYGANFKNIKNKHGHTVLQQELRSLCLDRIILEAIVNAVVKVPSLTSIGIYIRHRAPQHAAKVDWYNAIANTPRTLQHHCRCAVRHALGILRLKHVSELPLPETLKDYLLLDVEYCR